MLTFETLVPTAPKGRFSGINRTYAPEDVHRLRGSIRIHHTLAEAGANRLWQLLQNEPFVAALGAATGNQAMQMVKAGLQCVYLSGWQVAADNNTAGSMFPDQSLYPSSSGPELCRRINRTLSGPIRSSTQRAMFGIIGLLRSLQMRRRASEGRSTPMRS